MITLWWRFTCRDCDEVVQATEYGWVVDAAQSHGDWAAHAAQVEAVFLEALTELGYRRRAWRGRPGPPRRV